MRRYPNREEQKAMLRLTDYCGRHRRRFHLWTERGGKLVAQRCYQCEQEDQRARAPVPGVPHG